MIEFYETSLELEAKKNAELEGILFGREDCLPSHAYGPTIRVYHLFHFVTKGSGILIIDGKTYEIGAGDAFLIPAEKLSYYKASAQNPWSYHWTGMTGYRSDHYVRQLLSVNHGDYVFRNLSIEKYASAIDSLATETRTNAETYFRSKAVLYTLLSYLAADLSGSAAHSQNVTLAARIKFFLDAKYMEKIRLEDLAAIIGVHPNHLSRVFSTAYGISPKQYLNDRKMEKAAQMLLSSELPVSLIGEALGFEDQHIFSRAFKNYYGKSPLLYRKTTTDSAPPSP